MSKITIIKNPHTDKVLNAIKVVSLVCLWIAVLGSSTMYYSSISSFLVDNGFSMDGYVWWLTVACSLLFSTFVGFFGIKYCISYFLYDWHMRSNKSVVDGSPLLSPILRWISLICAVAFLWLEGTAALNGADITAAKFTPKTKSLTSVISEAEQMKQNALAPVKAKVLDIEAKIEQEVEQKTSGNLQKLVNEKNTWAKNEVSKIRAEVEATHRKEYKKAKDEFAKAEKEWNEKTSQIAKVDGKLIENNLKTAEKRQVALTTILRYLYFAALVLSLILMIAITASEVTDELPALKEDDILEYAKRKKVGFFEQAFTYAKNIKPKKTYKTRHSKTVDIEENAHGLGKSLF